MSQQRLGFLQLYSHRRWAEESETGSLPEEVSGPCLLVRRGWAWGPIESCVETDGDQGTSALVAATSYCPRLPQGLLLPLSSPPSPLAWSALYLTLQPWFCSHGKGEEQRA